MDGVKKVAIKIQGKEYHITCKENEEYIQKLAYYVDRKIDQIESANVQLDTSRISILTALNIADELFKAVNTIETLRKKSGDNVKEDFYLEVEKIQKEEIPKESEK